MLESASKIWIWGGAGGWRRAAAAAMVAAAMAPALVDRAEAQSAPATDPASGPAADPAMSAILQQPVQASRGLGLWGFTPSADGGVARTCTEDDDGIACLLIYCRGDGDYWLALEPTEAVRAIDDQDGAVAFGAAGSPVRWALVEGPEPGKPVWVSDIVDLGAFFAELTAAGETTVRFGADAVGAPLADYTFSMAASDVALGLLRLRCQRAAQAPALGG